MRNNVRMSERQSDNALRGLLIISGRTELARGSIDLDHPDDCNLTGTDSYSMDGAGCRATSQTDSGRGRGWENSEGHDETTLCRLGIGTEQSQRTLHFSEFCPRGKFIVDSAMSLKDP